jgi:hypothetical protein
MNALVKSSLQSPTLELRTFHPSASTSETLPFWSSNISASPNLPLAFGMSWALMPSQLLRTSSACLKSILKFLQHFSSKLKRLAFYQALTKIFALQTEMLKCHFGHWILTRPVIIPASTLLICLCDLCVFLFFVIKLTLSKVLETVPETFQPSFSRNA